VPNTQYPLAKRAGAPAFNAINATPRSRPGGYAYPGTMVVGDGSMTLLENQVHFGGWCIVSSPMILAFNLSDTARRELVWSTITNKEAIRVNQVRICCALPLLYIRPTVLDTVALSIRLGQATPERRSSKVLATTVRSRSGGSRSVRTALQSSSSTRRIRTATAKSSSAASGRRLRTWS